MKISTSIISKAAILTAALPFLYEYVNAERMDARLWLPEINHGCTVEYKGKDINALQAKQILSTYSPDEYFTNVRLVETRRHIGNAEAYTVDVDSASRSVTVEASSGRGLLYGALSLYRHNACTDRSDSPVNDLRILNHWDNLDGTIERGYAGKSIWDWNRPMTEDQKRLMKNMRWLMPWPESTALSSTT